MAIGAGTRLLNGEYEVHEFLGHGSFGDVYRATLLATGGARALKVLRRDAPGVGSEVIGSAAARLRAECEIAERVRHENVLMVYHAKDTAEGLCAVLELASGGSVRDLIERDGAVPLGHAVAILIDAARGLDAMHRQRFVHRDVKPSNILLTGPATGTGRAKLADFGLAQWPAGTAAPTGIGDSPVDPPSIAPPHPGTREYSSPEHSDGSQPLLPTSDVYSLGCVAFEMLTGRLWKEARLDVDRCSELRPEIPAWLDAVVARMLVEQPGARKAHAADPSRRYVGMAPVVEALESGLADDARAAAEGTREARAREQQQQREREAALRDQRQREERERRERKEAEARRRAAEDQRAREEQQRRQWEQVLRWVFRVGGGLLVVMGLVGIVGMLVLLVSVVLRGSGGGSGAVAPTPPTASVTPSATAMQAPSPTASAPATDTRAATPTATRVSGLPAAGATRTSSKDGMVMVNVPAGTFLMGAAVDDSEAWDDERPQQKVNLDAYWIDRTEVTNSMFARFVAATGFRTTAEETGSSTVFRPPDDIEEMAGAAWRFPEGPGTDVSERAYHPVVHVTWHDAAAYCHWADRHLPTEAQWEKAARGPDGQKYPWGDAAPAGHLLNLADRSLGVYWTPPGLDDAYMRTAPVGSYPDGASPYGAFDMAGNVWEWVYDRFDADSYATPFPDRNDQRVTADNRVARGGSWSNRGWNVRSSCRNRLPPTNSYFNVGFRCAAP